MRWLALALVAAPIAAGCNTASTSDAGTADGGVTTPDAGHVDAGGPPPTIGSFQVRLVDPAPPNDGYTSVFGKVYDGPTPQAIIWDLKKTDGPCRLLEPRVPFCNTPCGGSAACVADDTCQAYPRAKSVGDVTVRGLRPMEFAMSPISNNYQTPVGLTLPYPAFDEGGAISVEAAGGALAGFSISAKGVAPLVLGAGELMLQSGSALQLSWTPPAMGGVSSIHVKLDISHHGGTKGMIECDAADLGALTISAPLIGDLLALGVAGFPTIIVTRSAKGTASIAQGIVELAVIAEVEAGVKIPGLTSCTDDTECPMGTTCQADLTCK